MTVTASPLGAFGTARDLSSSQIPHFNQASRRLRWAIFPGMRDGADRSWLRARACRALCPARGSSLSASRSRRFDRLLQHELALLLHQGLCLVGQHRKQPGELHLKPDVVLSDTHGPGRGLSKEAGTKIEVIARPLVLEHEQARAVD